ncbi:ZIP family metal transporter [Candidatus Woesearchaeota archaeon]|nr:ZIP family metal transporter [Candidatus Woesearchaeota archaeon]
MAEIWLYSIISVLVVSLISLIGIFTLAVKLENLKRILFFFVSFSVGALFGAAFLHLLPEAMEEFGLKHEICLSALAGIVIFFIVEKFVHWRHCHIPTSKEHPHPFAIMNLVGDAVHNFIDGLVIAGSFMASVALGITTTVAVALHEIPQEIGDFSVLVHGGFKRSKALFLNFMTALTAVLGVVVSLLIGVAYENYLMFLLPFTAGGFIYIAGSDLIPELHKECKASRSLLQLFGLLLGIGIMMLLAH